MGRDTTSCSECETWRESYRTALCENLLLLPLSMAEVVRCATVGEAGEFVLRSVVGLMFVVLLVVSGAFEGSGRAEGGMI